MGTPELERVPQKVRDQLTRMVGCRVTRHWIQDDVGDLHVLVDIPSTNNHWHFLWVWCGDDWYLWSACIADETSDITAE
jgi:hypothetical protein